MKILTLTRFRSPLRVSVVLLAAIALSTTALSASASGSGSQNAQRQNAAERDVAALLGAAPFPPGSRQITAAAAETTKPFNGAKSITYGGNEVGSTRFYVAPSAVSSLDWLKTQRLEGHAAASTTSSGSTRAQIYELPNTSYLLQREVLYVALIKSDGTLEYSVTATVWWRSAKTSGSVVAPGAAKLTVRLNRGLNDKKHRYQSVTTTRTSLIAAITKHIDVLGVASPLPTSCPNDVASSLTMSFYRANATKPYAVVIADPSGCGTVTVSQYNTDHQITSSSDLTGGRQLSSFVATQLGLTDISPV
ncbi:MAG: hypothetical protein WA359_04885 [Acidimicrobiales bacterium]